MFIILIIIWNDFRSLAIVIRQENKTVPINNDNEELKLSLCILDMSVYIEDSRDTIKKCFKLIR